MMYSKRICSTNVSLRSWKGRSHEMTDRGCLLDLTLDASLYLQHRCDAASLGWQYYGSAPGSRGVAFFIQFSKRRGRVADKRRIGSAAARSEGQVITTLVLTCSLAGTGRNKVANRACPGDTSAQLSEK